MAGGPLDDDIRELDGATNGFVVADAIRPSDESIAVGRDPPGDRRAGLVREWADGGGWGERLGHEVEADLGEADVECGVVDATPRPVDQPDLVAPDEHVAGPKVTVDESQAFWSRRPVGVEPVDRACNCRLIGEVG
jgi:hypothetical protein